MRSFNAVIDCVSFMRQLSAVSVRFQTPSPYEAAAKTKTA